MISICFTNEFGPIGFQKSLFRFECWKQEQRWIGTIDWDPCKRFCIVVGNFSVQEVLGGPLVWSWASLFLARSYSLKTERSCQGDSQLPLILVHFSQQGDTILSFRNYIRVCRCTIGSPVGSFWCILDGKRSFKSALSIDHAYDSVSLCKGTCRRIRLNEGW